MRVANRPPNEADRPNQPSLTVVAGSIEFPVAPPASGGEDRPALPEVGEQFLDFELVSELGRGAFGRVFLARQQSLAGRFVALKVSAELFDETQTLAQLQHTNIVPIYSAHRAGRLQAVCMPYFGSTTLADVFLELQDHAQLPKSGKHFISTLEHRKHSTRNDLIGSHYSSDEGAVADPSGTLARPAPGSQPTFELLSGFSFVDAVLWLGARLAEALAHAHERGVVHRDLKPANVLLADDGRPMILDFNLAGSLRQPDRRRGGTLPYMAPEQLRTYSSKRNDDYDQRVDIYSLGLVLFELLAGRPAFPRRSGKATDIAGDLIADRRIVPELRKHNPAITPAVEVIVRKCLAFAPEDRYQTATQLLQDIECQLAHEPLRHTPEPSIRERASKWALRHPRASSGATLTLLAIGALGLLGFGLLRHRDTAIRQAEIAATANAQHELTRFLHETDQIENDLIRAPEGDTQTSAVARAKAALGRYALPSDTTWAAGPFVANLPPEDVGRLRQRAGRILFFLTQDALDRASRPGAPVTGHVGLNQLHEMTADVLGCRPQAWWVQRASVMGLRGQHEDARVASETARSEPIRGELDQYLAAVEHYQSGRYSQALRLLEELTRRDSQSFAGWHLLGACHYRLQNDQEAITAFNVGCGLSPKNYRPYANRGFAHFRQGKKSMALADFEIAMHLGDPSADVAFRRAVCLSSLNRLPEAEAVITGLIEDERYAMRAYFVRADLRRKMNQKELADADVLAAVAIKPVTAADYNARGIYRRSRDSAAALKDFQKSEQLNPWFTSALQNQADVLANTLNRPEESIQALNRLLERSPDQPQALASRAVMLARVGRIDEALRDVEVVLARFDQPMLRYQVAGVYARSTDRAGHLEEALRLLCSAIRQNGSLADLLRNDPDLKPIADRPEFRKILDAVAALRSYD